MSENLADHRGKRLANVGTRRRTVFVWWRGPKSIVDHPKVLAAVEAGLIDDEDVWADEYKRVIANPYHATRIMGPTNVYGAQCPERLERVYVWGPEPWEMCQEVLTSDADQILRGPSRKEFQLMRATTITEAQEEVWDLLFPQEQEQTGREFTLACRLLDGIDMPLHQLMEFAVPVARGGL